MGHRGGRSSACGKCYNERATYRVGSPQAWPGPVRSTSQVRLPQAVSSALASSKPPAVRLRRRARGMGACTARTCTPRETTVTHLRLQRGALPLVQQHPAQQQGLAGGRGQPGRQWLQRRRPPEPPSAGHAQRGRRAPSQYQASFAATIATAPGAPQSSKSSQPQGQDPAHKRPRPKHARGPSRVRAVALKGVTAQVRTAERLPRAADA